METQTLNDICEYRKGKVNVAELSVKNYISTENLQPNKGGLADATSLPTTDTTQEYCVGDVLVSNIRPYFKKIWLAKDNGGCSNDVLVFKAKPETDTTFLYYVLANDKFFEYSTASSKGTKMPRGDKSAIMMYEVPKLEIDEQKKIGEMLKCIDEKIAVNTEINRNLEEQALVLFKSYFIDYEPYGGMQPEDWETVSLDDVCIKITDGSHYSPKDDPEAIYPMYSVKDMETYGFNPSSCKHIGDDELDKMKRNDCVPKLNDILVAKDGSYLKEIFICSETRDEAILSSIAIFRPDTAKIIPEVLLYLLKQPSVRKDVGDNYVSGSALPRIVLKDFKKYTFILPPLEEQKKIGDVLMVYRKQIKTNVDENQRLIKLRDNVLPKLMSGELDVSEIEVTTENE